MPKNDEALQKELGVPKSYKVTPIEENYPRIISEVHKENSQEKVISPTQNGSFTRESYDETIGEEENLHTQYVKANEIEVSPKSFKE